MIRLSIATWLGIAAALAPAGALAAGMPDDCSKAQIPNQTAKGRIGAITFLPDHVAVATVNHPEMNGVAYDAYDLHFQMRYKQGDNLYVDITTIVPKGQPHDGRTFRMLPTKDTRQQPMAGPGAPEVQGWAVQYDPQKIPASFVSAIGSLRVEYGTRRGDRLPGRIYFCTTAAQGSYLAGTFEVDMGE
jgi:hypothetical protein